MTTSYQDDKDLIKAVRLGDQLAFKEIVLKYENDIARVLIGMLGNKADADDIGQETFIRFYNSIDQYKGDSSLKTYLTRIGINLSINEINKRKRNKWYSFTDNPQIDRNGDNEAEKIELTEIIDKALIKLEPQFRTVVVLRLVQGYSTKETAKILELPVGTALSRLARAQEKLRKIIGQKDRILGNE